MAIIVDPYEEYPTHHVSLSDGDTTIGLIVCDADGNAAPKNMRGAPIQRTAIKTSTGNQKYSDFESPWTPQAQEDWTGGRGNLDFEDDTTKYWDSWRLNTINKRVILGPQEQYAFGAFKGQNNYTPGDMTWMSVLPGDYNYLANSFVVGYLTGVGYTAKKVSAYVRKIGDPANSLHVDLCSDNGGNPGATIASAVIATSDIDDVLSVMWDISVSVALTYNATYWVKFYSTDGTWDNHWEVGCGTAATAKKSSNNSLWQTSAYAPYYRVRAEDAAHKFKFFRYKYAEYMVTMPDTGASKLYMNGYRGLANTNVGQLNYLGDINATWTIDQWAGCIAMVIAGNGVQEDINYRTVVSNAYNTLLVDTPWKIAHLGSKTQYVILGSDVWYEISTPLITQKVTDVLVNNSIVYFCQGDDYPIIRMRELPSGTTYLREFAAETRKATFLCAVQSAVSNIVDGGTVTAATNETPIVITTDTAHSLTTGAYVMITGVTGNTAANGYWKIRAVTATSFALIGSIGNGTFATSGTWKEGGGVEIWRANNSDINGNISVSKSITVDWGTNLEFSNPVIFHDDTGKINGLVEYGDDKKQLYVLREGLVYAMNDDIPEKIPLSEMQAIMMNTNGRSVLVHNVYLYFNLMGGLERYYNRTLDDVGPNLGDGLPEERQGIITDMAGYPGRYFVAMDCGDVDDKTSSILMSNGTGWHEIYRAPMPNMRIRSMAFQVIPGNTPDRLWVQVGGDIIYLPFPTGTLDPMKDSNYLYHHEGALISGWMTAGMVDIYKLYNSLKVFADNLAEDAIEIRAQYQVDDDETWYDLYGTINTSPMQEIDFKETLGLVGKRMRLRLIFSTNDASISPQLDGIVIECVSRVMVKYGYTFAFRDMDDDVNLRGDPEEMDADDRHEKIMEWVTNVTPLTMRSIYERFDDITVFIDPPPISPNAEVGESYVNKMTVTGI